MTHPNLGPEHTAGEHTGALPDGRPAEPVAAALTIHTAVVCTAELPGGARQLRRVWAAAGAGAPAWIGWPGGSAPAPARRARQAAAGPAAADAADAACALSAAGVLHAPMAAMVLAVVAAPGAAVAAGDVLVVLEAMKMEHRMVAPAAGHVAAVHVQAGDRVEAQAQLVTLAAGEGAQDG